MDGIANVAKQQQTQVSTKEIQSEVQNEVSNAQVTQQSKPSEVEMSQKLENNNGEDDSTNKINSLKQVEDLVEQLNEALAPMSTSLKFGVDTDDIFYVSVIETKSNEMIRRFPAKQAADFLPKMQEVTGILFDSKG